MSQRIYVAQTRECMKSSTSDEERKHSLRPVCSRTARESCLGVRFGSRVEMANPIPLLVHGQRHSYQPAQLQLILTWYFSFWESNYSKQIWPSRYQQFSKSWKVDYSRLPFLWFAFLGSPVLIVVRIVNNRGFEGLLWVPVRLKVYTNLNLLLV